MLADYFQFTVRNWRVYAWKRAADHAVGHCISGIDGYKDLSGLGTYLPSGYDGRDKILMALCEKYPDIPIIFGHLGGSNWMEVIKYAKGHGNVYLDLSAAFASIATKMALGENISRLLKLH